MPLDTEMSSFRCCQRAVPDDVVFTVEYSVRSAQLAAYALLGVAKTPPPVYQGKFDPRVLFRAFKALHDLRPTLTAPLLEEHLAKGGVARETAGDTA